MRVHEIKKVSKSFDELLTFLLMKEYDKIACEINFLDDKIIIILKIDNLRKEDCVILSEALSNERNESLEEFGWELLGESEDSTELELIGALFDEFELEIDNETTTIELTRYFH